MDPSPVFNTLPLSVKVALLIVLLVVVGLRSLLETLYSILKLFRSRPHRQYSWRIQRELKFQRKIRFRVRSNK